MSKLKGKYITTGYNKNRVFISVDKHPYNTSKDSHYVMLESYPTKLGVYRGPKERAEKMYNAYIEYGRRLPQDITTKRKGREIGRLV